MTKDEQATLQEIYHRLYGEGNFEGDIPEIKAHLKDLNGNILRNTIRGVQNERSLGLIKWVIGGIGALLISIIGLLVWLI